MSFPATGAMSGQGAPVPPHRTPFEALVEDYDAARPCYPAALYDAIETLVGPLAGRTVIDIGAGTGIATRALRERGAWVAACDLGENMLRRNVERSPGLPAVIGDANGLPFAEGAADVIACAQAWHWVDVPIAAANAARVLRASGALVLWWNEVTADGTAWFDAQQERLAASSPGYARGYRDRPYEEELVATGLFTTVSGPELSWLRSVDLETYLAWLRSKSYVAAMGSAEPGFLAAERRSLAAAFPDGMVREPFRVRLIVARPVDR